MIGPLHDINLCKNNCLRLISIKAPGNQPTLVHAINLGFRSMSNALSKSLTSELKWIKIRERCSILYIHTHKRH